MQELTKLSVAALSKGLEAKEFSAKEVTEAYIKKMEDGRRYNAYITETPELAISQAKAADERIANNNRLSNFDGIPVGVKDLFCTKGVRTTAASHFLENFIPPYESTVTSKLLSAGAVFLGKTNLDEFAMGGANQTSYFGQVINPHVRADGEEVVPGGSSGGSAAAVAGELCACALGTDTGGSIREPASFCGIVGLKPTYGRCSRYGIVAFASSLDQAGPMAKTVEDAALMLNHIAGFDEKDSTSANIEVGDFTKNLKAGIKGLKVGIPKELLEEKLNEEVCAFWQKGREILEKNGAELVEISLPNIKYALATYYIIAPAEASSNLARYDGLRFGLRVNGDSLDEMYENSRSAGFGDEVKRRIMIGTYVLSAGYYDAYYQKALDVRKLIRNDYLKAFEKVDIIFTPTAPGTAFSLKEGASFDPITNYLQDIFTVTANLAELPAISVPVGLAKNNLPIGMQIFGKHFDEATILKAAYTLENGGK